MTKFAQKGRCFAVAGLLVLGLSACSGDDDEYVEAPPETFYNKGINELLDGNYKTAAKDFDEVERQHPYSVWAPRAQLMAAYAHYQNNKYDDAINTLDRFIQLHPGNRDVAYAYYLKGISYYEQISDVGRDQEMTQLALTALDEVVRRYPSTEYARDAKLKIDLARDHLAGKEMEIGRFYMNQGEYLAAINRYRRVIVNYQTTTHVPEALHRLVESYLALGVDREAQATAAVLGYNYPGSEWYTDSYALLTGVDLAPEAQEGSWISRQWNKVF
ncbi:outer membrane protein assembly factor BamD [Rhodovibrionaceae bacterium A322]